MKGFGGFGNSPVKQDIFSTKKHKQALKEYKSQQKDFLSSKDLTANQDTVRQSNIDYFKKYSFGPGGSISKGVISDTKKKQVNKNIDLSSKPGAGSRASERIQKHRSVASEHGTLKNLKTKTNKLSQRIKAKDLLKSHFSKNPIPKPTKPGKIKQGYAPISFPLGRKI